MASSSLVETSDSSPSLPSSRVVVLSAIASCSMMPGIPPFPSFDFLKIALSPRSVKSWVASNDRLRSESVEIRPEGSGEVRCSNLAYALFDPAPASIDAFRLESVPGWLPLRLAICAGGLRVGGDCSGFMWEHEKVQNSAERS